MLYLKLFNVTIYESNLSNRLFSGKDSDPILDDISFNIDRGEIFGIVGPSGCGKTVLLKTIAGLFFPEEGEIYIDGETVTKAKPSERGVSMVFQDFVLYPHMTNLNNIRFSASANPMNLESVARLLHIEEKKLLDKFPRYTSLGERQRVSIGKALISRPKILLLDEPLSNVEDSLRIEIRHNMKKLIKENGITTIYVSHNQTEIGEISDNIAVMRKGKFEQTGSYLDLYDNPKTLFVSTLIGEKSSNFLTSGEVSSLTGGKIKYSLTIRPGECGLEEKGESISIEGKVSFIENFIQESKKIVFLNKEGELFGVEVSIDYPVNKDDSIKIYIPIGKAKFFDDIENSESPSRVYNLW